MEQLSARKASRGKSSAYASMIRELLQEIEKLTAENQQLKKEVALAKTSVIEEAERLAAFSKEREIMQKEREALERRIRSQEEQLASDKIMEAVQQANRESQMNRLQQENIALKDQIASLKREKNADKNSHNNELSLLKKEIMILKGQLEQFEKEKQAMLTQIEEKDNFHRQEVEELRKINALIKKNFQIMEEDYDALLKITEEQHSVATLRHRQAKPKKETITLKKRKQSSSNPQMQEELWRIKQQVSQQMARMNCSREQAVKGRVDRTLATIESLLTEMSQKVDPSDEESNCD